jgi:hypothetical protein
VIVSSGPPLNVIPQPGPEDAVDIVLKNPRKNGGPISYTVNKLRYTMQPGYAQTLPGGRRWTLEFDRGGSFGTARYALPPGNYVFTVTDRGWDVALSTEPLPPSAPALAQASP